MAYARKRTYRRKPTRRRRYSTRRRAPARRRRATTRTRQMAKPKVSKYVLAQIDPFNEKILGVKVPDMNTQPSTTMCIEDEFVVVTPALFGCQALALRPFVTGTEIDGVSASATTWTWPAAYAATASSSQQANVVSNNTAVRPVAHGIRVSSALPTTTAQGFVHFCIVTDTTYNQTTWGFPTSIAQMQNSQWYKRYPISMLTQKPLIVTNKILDVTSQKYFDPSSTEVGNSTNTDFQTTGWATIILAVSGVPVATTALNVEHIIHIEGLPSATSVQQVSPGAPFNSNLMEAAANIAARVPAVHEENPGIFGNFVSGASDAFMDLAGQAYAAAGRTAYSAGQYGFDRALRYVFNAHAGGDVNLVNRPLLMR